MSIYGPKSRKCPGCGNRTTAAGSDDTGCRSCQSKLFHTRKRIEREGLIVDTAGGLWWVWDARGTVLVLGKATKGAAIRSLAWEGEHEDESVGAAAPV